MTKITKLLSNSRGLGNLVRRVGTVFSRFGISPKKFESRLNRYWATSKKLGCVPTFPLTAVTLKRHPTLIKRLSQEGIEFAVHGYIHADHKPLSSEEQTRHFKKAIVTFKNCQIPYSGFRAPYLRVSTETPEVLSSLDFLYDSSHAIHWDVIEENGHQQQGWNEYIRLLDFYQARSAQDYLALPRFTNGIVEIPVSIPDDEALVDRLSLRSENEITKVWNAILERTYSRGELFTVQLHPERIPYCGSALEHVLQRAKELKPPIWVATLAEIAQWWQERDKFSLEVNPEGKGRYGVKATCSERATLLLKNCRVNGPVAEWSEGYQCTGLRDFVVESPKRPVVGVRPDSSPDAVNFLNGEGFVVEQSDQPDNYGIYLSELADFQISDEKPLSETIERSSAPLVRYWRWPHQARSALAITGDIDSMTLIDFVLRLFETWRQNSR